MRLLGELLGANVVIIAAIVFVIAMFALALAMAKFRSATTPSTANRGGLLLASLVGIGTAVWLIIAVVANA
jgi:hypothetical protein